MIYHQILESIVRGPRVHSEVTISTCKQGNLVGGGGCPSLPCFFHTDFPWSSKALQPWTLFLCCAHIPLAQAWNGMLGMSPPSKIFLDQAYPFSLKNLCCTAFASPTFIFLYIFKYGPNHENSRAPVHC